MLHDMGLDSFGLGVPQPGDVDFMGPVLPPDPTKPSPGTVPVPAAQALSVIDSLFSKGMEIQKQIYEQKLIQQGKKGLPAHIPGDIGGGGWKEYAVPAVGAVVAVGLLIWLMKRR